MHDAIQRDLPNFPGDVISQWLLPYAEIEGWPPATDYETIPLGRWKYLLGMKPLQYWRSLNWQSINRHISFSQLTPGDQEKIKEIVLAAVVGQVNLYSESIPDLHARFARVIEYIREYGVIPKAPILVAKPDGISIVDGNHRMAAYFYCYGYFNLDIEVGLTEKMQEEQNYWLATSP